MYKDDSKFFVAIGNNGTRQKIQKNLISKGLLVASLIHPKLIIGIDVDIDTRKVVMAGVVINSSSKISVKALL